MARYVYSTFSPVSVKSTSAVLARDSGVAHADSKIDHIDGVGFFAEQPPSHVLGISLGWSSERTYEGIMSIKILLGCILSFIG